MSTTWVWYKSLSKNKLTFLNDQIGENKHHRVSRKDVVTTVGMLAVDCQSKTYSNNY
jgi:hypothetical protein